MKIQRINSRQKVNFQGDVDFFAISLNAMRAREKEQSLQPLVDKVLPSLNSVDTKEKLQAIRLLTSIGSEKELPDVINFMQKEKDLYLKAEGIHFIEKFGSEEQREIIYPYLKSENHQLKTASLKYAATHGLKEDAKLIEPILADAKTYQDKYEALRFFVHKGTKEHANTVKKFLLDTNKNIENLAQKFFDKNGTKKQKEIVNEMMNVETPSQAFEIFFKYCEDVFNS